MRALDARYDGQPALLDEQMLAVRHRRKLLAELDAVRAERDEARAQIGDVRASISAHKIRVATDERDEAIDRAERAEAGLRKINEIRNSIVGAQTVNFSEHIYPLVAALNESGVQGLPYPEARENVGTLIDRANSAEAGLAALRDADIEYDAASLAYDAAFREASALPRLVRASERRRAALADTATAAEAYTRRVRAEALEAAGDAYECDEDHDDTGGVCPKRWLRARAAEIRGGL